MADPSSRFVATIAVLKAAAAKKGRTIDVAGARAEIAAAIARHEAADLYDASREDQVRTREAKRKLAPLLRDLVRVRTRLNGIGGERWRDLLGHDSRFDPNELRRVIDSSEVELRDVVDSEGKNGRPIKLALGNLVLPLADVYEKHTGRSPSPVSNRSGGDKSGDFVAFVRAVVGDANLSVPLAGLGNKIANVINQDRSLL